MDQTTHVEPYIERRLEQVSRPRSSYEYWVTGMGSFPLEMLAHDRAWPATPDEAVKLDIRRSHPFRSVKLMSNKRPNTDRWWSYSWKVTDHAAF